MLDQHVSADREPVAEDVKNGCLFYILSCKNNALNRSDLYKLMHMYDIHYLEI